MARAAKVPQSYHFYIAALQRLIPLTGGDPRLDSKEKAEIVGAVNGITSVMSKASARPLPLPAKGSKK